jgi:NAD(P)-dependent dehydrogenase (short-subunit alcohol dehydrogenase family)
VTVDMTVAVVTGAASGMGRLCVESMRGTTDHLVTVDLVAPQIEGTRGIACDVSDPNAVAELAARVHALGSFRGLAHAAGVSPTMTHSRRVLEIDLVGTAQLLEAFEPLVEPGSAAVCFSSSSAYQVALQGIDTQLQALVSEPLVRVNSLAPGLIDTPMGRQEAEQQPIMKVMLEKTPLERLGQPSEVAAVVAFLLSESASFISAIDILVDGGMLRGLIASFPR